MVSCVSFVAGRADRNNARRISVARQGQRNGKRAGVAALIRPECQTDDEWFSFRSCGFIQKVHRREKVIFFEDGSIGGHKIKIFQILFGGF